LLATKTKLINDKVGKTSVKHNKQLSMPKLQTNNIFYIINQNPQVNTHITIYNNESKNKKESTPSKLNTAREKERLDSIAQVLIDKNVRKDLKTINVMERTKNKFD